MTNASQLPLYGRKWEVVVTQLVSKPLPVGVVGPPQSVPSPILSVSDNGGDPAALRVTFDIYTPAIHAVFWYADICLYNLDQVTTDQLLGQQSQGLTVTVSAGYQNGNYGVIWSGTVFQAFFERENVVDYKLTLHCVLSLPTPTDENNIGQTFDAFTSQNQIVQGIAKMAFTPVVYVSPLKTTKLSRAKTVFGNPAKYLTQIAEDNNIQWWLDSKGLTMGGPSKEDTIVSTANPLVFSPPNYSLNGAGPSVSPDAGVIIGTPQQTMYGVMFRVLLDPRVQVQVPYIKVKIDNTQLRYLKRQVGQYVGLLDKDGEYIVAAVRFTGDTRGQDWYADIHGFTVIGNQISILQAEAAAASLNGGGY
jgi:hypothetical protein